MTLMLALGALSVWAATMLQPGAAHDLGVRCNPATGSADRDLNCCAAGTFLPPLSWPILSACMHVALLHRRRRLDAIDKRHAAAGLASAAMLLVFLLQDGEFSGWGE